MVNHRLLHGLQIVPVHFAANRHDKFLVSLEFHVVNRHLVHFVDNALVVRSQNLCAVVPISLVAVVFLRVVARRHVHAGLRTEVANRVGNLRRGSQALEEINLDAVGRENVGNRLGEEPSVVAAVVAHDHRALLARKSLQNVVGEALRRHSHDVDVHTVRSGTHNATQSARAKFKVAVERVDERRFVLTVKHCLNFLACLLVERGGEPLLGPCLTLGNQFFVCFHIVFDVFLFVIFLLSIDFAKLRKSFCKDKK